MHQLSCRMIIFIVALSGLLLRAKYAAADEFDSNGVLIHYTVEGTGAPVILVHGYRATGDINWRLTGVLGLLKQKYQVITLDNRGHGQSGKPRIPEEYGVQMAEDVIRLMDHLHLKTAHIVGYSMGGMITLKLAAIHPERLRSALIGGMGYSEYRPWSQEKSAAEKDLAPLAACAQAFSELGISPEQLAAIKVPMTVVIGTDDRLKNRVDALHSLRSDVPIVWIEGANHTSCNFRKEFRQGIWNWVDGQEGK